MRTETLCPPATKVLERLFLGSLENAEELTLADLHQIRTVVTLCEDPVQRQTPAIRYLQFRVRDARPIPIAWLNAILTAVEERMARGPSLVKCLAACRDRRRWCRRPFSTALARWISKWRFDISNT